MKAYFLILTLAILGSNLANAEQMQMTPEQVATRSEALRIDLYAGSFACKQEGLDAKMIAMYLRPTSGTMGPVGTNGNLGMTLIEEKPQNDPTQNKMRFVYVITLDSHNMIATASEENQVLVTTNIGDDVNPVLSYGWVTTLSGYCSRKN